MGKEKTNDVDINVAEDDGDEELEEKGRKERGRRERGGGGDRRKGWTW